LVLDDVADLLDLFKEMLENEGYRVTLGSMVEGELGRTLDEVKAVMPDVLILDFLFGNDPLGWQLLQLLRMDPATAGLPVVVCSGAVDHVVELSAQLGAMAAGVVIKPFDVDVLLVEVRRVLDRSKAESARLPEPPRTDAAGAGEPAETDEARGAGRT